VKRGARKRDVYVMCDLCGRGARVKFEKRPVKETYWCGKRPAKETYIWCATCVVEERAWNVCVVCAYVCVRVCVYADFAYMKYLQMFMKNVYRYIWYETYKRDLLPWKETLKRDVWNACRCLWKTSAEIYADLQPK